MLTLNAGLSLYFSSLINPQQAMRSFDSHVRAASAIAMLRIGEDRVGIKRDKATFLNCKASGHLYFFALEKAFVKCTIYSNSLYRCAKLHLPT